MKEGQGIGCAIHCHKALWKPKCDVLMATLVNCVENESITPHLIFDTVGRGGEG